MNNFYKHFTSIKAMLITLCFMAIFSIQASSQVTLTYFSKAYNFQLHQAYYIDYPMGNADSNSVSPTALPPGLLFDPSTGNFSGRTYVNSTFAPTQYIVSGYEMYRTGNVLDTLEFSTTENASADFTYSSPDTLTQGQPASLSKTYASPITISAFYTSNVDTPTSIAINANYLFVLASGQVIQVSKATGQAVTLPISGATRLATDRKQNIYYYSSGTVYQTTNNGLGTTTSRGTVSGLNALDADTLGNLYEVLSATPDSIIIVPPTGLPTVYSLHGSYNNYSPKYMSVNPYTQDIYIYDSSTKAVFKVPTVVNSSNIPEQMTVSGLHSNGISADVFQDVYVLDSTNKTTPVYFVQNGNPIYNDFGISGGFSSGRSIVVDLTSDVYTVVKNSQGYTVYKEVGGFGTTTSTSTDIAWSISPALPAGLSINSSTGAITGTPTMGSPSTTYVVTASNSGGSNFSTITLAVSGAWTGAVNANWNTARNWIGNILPTSSTGVTIPSGTPHNPIIRNIVSVKDITIQAGANLNIINGDTLSVLGNINNGDTIYANNGALNLAGTAAQSINGVNYTNNLIINNSAGVSITGGNTTVYGTYTPTAGVLTTGGYLTLASNDTATASIGQGTGAYSSGNVIVERYIPAHRAWRFLTSPVNTNTSIYNSWQNGGVVTDSTGVEIWDPQGIPASNGMLNGGGAPNAEYFNPLTNAWVGLTSTDTALLYSNTGSAFNNAYGVFVTGPYGSGKIKPLQGDTSTTLLATGALETGTQTFTYNNVPAGNYVLVGNPYASLTNFTNVGATGAASGNINNIMWAWDAQRSGTSYGGYVTFSWDGTTDSYDQDVPTNQTVQTIDIQSGQAVFVQADTTTHTNGTPENVTITFAENDKVMGSGTNQVFGVTVPPSQVRIALNRVAGSVTTPVDGILVKYNNNYKPGVSDDADKLYNYDENLALRINTQYLSIERRPNPVATDTLFLDIYALKQNTNYSFSINPQNINLGEGIQPYLVDKFLNTVTPISFTANNTVSFSTTDAAASSSETRFTIVFSANALATTFTSVKATQLDKGINVQWNVATETGIKNYTVEKSADGITFNYANTTAAINNNQNQTYNWLDAGPYDGDNYYRIKAVNKDGSSFYSNVVVVNIKLAVNFLAYPNPLPHNQQLKVDIGSMAAGKYTLQIFTTDGKKVMEKAITIDGNASTNFVNTPTLAPGVYQAVLVDENGKSWKQKLVVN